MDEVPIVSKLQSHYEDMVFFLPKVPKSPQGFVVLILTTLEGWMAE